MSSILCRAATLLSLCLVAIAGDVRAQDFPVRPVRIIVPYAPGGPVDIVTRVVSQQLYEMWKQPVVVESRPGAGGNVGSDLVAKAKPDGYTLLINTPAMIIAPSVYNRLPFDPFKDLVPVVNIGVAPALLVVSPQLPVKSVTELIAYAKANPGKLNFASPGTATSLHLAGEQFKSMAKIDMVHIPYKGVQPALIDIMGGQTQLMIDAIIDVLQHVQGGQLRALAITTQKRSSLAPDLPTISESGLPGYEFSLWYGIFAPAGTPPALVAQINRDIVRVINLPAVKDQMKTYGIEAIGNSPSEFATAMKGEAQKWADLVRTTGVKLE
jgi:tripartite-type tricarboxylate transporter receptor subunit TctC